MKILGIGGQGYRDSSAALLVDGEVVAAVSEERFSRTKHEGGFPRRAIEYCLKAGGLALEDVDRIALANNPWLNLNDRLEEWYGEGFLRTGRFRTFNIFHDELHATVVYLSEVERLRARSPESIRIVRHHLCHLAEAYYLSPFEEVALLAIDGRGELSTSCQGVGAGGAVEVFALEEMPNSIGLLTASVADYLGFREEDDEFRIMSISSIGKSRYLEKFREILAPAPEGRYTLNPDFFETFEGRAFPSERFAEELGPGREPDSKVEERHADIAASLQTALEEVALHMSRYLAERTGLPNLCLTGGVAQNWVLGGRLRSDGPFPNVHTGFAPGDEGTALGAALHVEAEEGSPRAGRAATGSHLGPESLRSETEEALRRFGIPFSTPDDPVAHAAERIAAGRLVGWYEGRAEFGPRALGHRSILVDPTNAAAKEHLVESVKPRARYHPFGIAVRDEDLARYFEDVRPDPHMASHRKVLPGMRDALAPIVHADGSARVQTVPADAGGSLPALLAAVGARTGHPVLLNTSMNTPGRPLAGTARDAVGTLFTSGLDDLYLDGLHIRKSDGSEA